MSRPYKVQLEILEVRNIYIDSAVSPEDAENQAVAALENTDYDGVVGEVVERDYSHVVAYPSDEEG